VNASRCAFTPIEGEKRFPRHARNLGSPLVLCQQSRQAARDGMLTVDKPVHPDVRPGVKRDVHAALQKPEGSRETLQQPRPDS
jgi:hypothetical protein